MSFIYLIKNFIDYNIFISKNFFINIYNFFSFYYIFLLYVLIVCFSCLWFQKLDSYFYFSIISCLMDLSIFLNYVEYSHWDDLIDWSKWDRFFLFINIRNLENFNNFFNNKGTFHNFSFNKLQNYYNDYMRIFYQYMLLLNSITNSFNSIFLLFLWHWYESLEILNKLLSFIENTIILIGIQIYFIYCLFCWFFILMCITVIIICDFSLMYYDLLFPWLDIIRDFIRWYIVFSILDVIDIIRDSNWDFEFLWNFSLMYFDLLFPWLDIIRDFIRWYIVFSILDVIDFVILDLNFYYVFLIIENKFFFYHVIFSFLEVFLVWVIFIIFFLRKNDIFFFRYSLIRFFTSIFLYFIFIYSISYKYYFSYYFFLNFFYLQWFNLNIIFGLDNIALIFILLTCFLFLISFLVSLNNIKYKFKFFIINLIFLEFLVILTFLSLNLFFFYIFFELSLIPMFFIIGFWGSRQRKLYAVYQFFFYTLLGSIFLLSAIIIMYSTFNTLDIQIISNFKINYDRQLILWLLLFLGFSTKIPLVPFHVWLPEAHVEAPTSGSIILAGILLKLGTYGILRFILPVFYYANYFYLPYIYTLCVISIIYISFITLIQIDLKKIIAYSSILHMNFIILGLFSFTLNGLIGSIFLMISHGLISAGLFICVGILYDRYKTRNIIYYGGVVDYMPLFSLCFFILILSNIGFPLTSNFIGEVLVCLGLIEINFFLVLLILISTFFSAVYSIWLFNRIIFGINKYLLQVSDLSDRECFILISIIFFIIVLGLQPNLLLDLIEFQVLYILEYINY